MSSSSRSEIERRFLSINMWKRGDERAPNKPLLLLYALGRFSRHGNKPIPYSEVDVDLRKLLIEFGPSRQSVHPEYPFWRLKHDGIWQVEREDTLERRKGNSDPKKSELLGKGIRGGFTPDVVLALQQNPYLTKSLAHLILEETFPSSVHEDILSAIGIDDQWSPRYVGPAKHSRRDPRFRQQVLTAYEQRCAICGFDVRLGGIQLGLDAAHIKWHQAGGPDVTENGIALCVLHHKLFDRGAFTISAAHAVEISEGLTGSTGFDAHLLNFHGKKMRHPQHPDHPPKHEYLDWHRRQVFQGPPRYFTP